ncbi:TTransposase [Phytophthora megakarya]|uniref:TTransposase n=1 Tax=Phytophthora megakarya TaxID=4795 RepID=A0A225VMH7_9STRA|nr:TTransposase [Phytophthora megakarya]
MSSMEYLGHELSAVGVRPLDRLVHAVREFATPTNAKEVKRFVHLAVYYRRFVKDFGTIMALLTKILRKNMKFVWETKQVEAFEQVKLILTSKPLLLYPDFSPPF